MKLTHKQTKRAAKRFVKAFGSKENVQLACGCGRMTVYDWYNGTYQMSEDTCRLLRIIEKGLKYNPVSISYPEEIRDIIAKIVKFKKDKG